jgi:hypothetical protein
MSDRRLDPEQLRARLQANLAAAVPRGQALPGGFDVAVAERRVETRADTAADGTDVVNPVAQIVSPGEVRSVPHALSVEGTGDLPGGSAAGSDPGPDPVTTDSSDPAADAPAKPRPTLGSRRVAAVARRSPKRRSGSNTGSEVGDDGEAKVVVHRCDGGAVLRGYRIPLDLHRRAERAKLRASADRGATLFWDEVLQSAIDALPEDVQRIAEGLVVTRGRAEPNPTTRVLQATIRHDQELRLRTLRLDLEEALDRTVRLEEIWSWMVREVVDGNLACL